MSNLNYQTTWHRATAVFLFVTLLFGGLLGLVTSAKAETMAVTTADHLLYVNHTASGTGDGLTWGNAFPHLQDALTLAATYAPTQTVEIWVAQGVYYPDEGVGYTNNERRHAFILQSNVALYGGFVGNETARDERDWNAYPTVLSGDIGQDDTVRPDGITNSYSDIVGNNSYHVVRAYQQDDTAVLDGFAITAGLANAATIIDTYFAGQFGAGINVREGGYVFRNLLIQGNSADYSVSPSVGRGGGMYVFRAGVQLENVAFRHNYAYHAGALYINKQTFPDNSFIKQVAFLHNSAVDGGAFSSINGSNHTFEDVVFAGNSASNDGGALYYWSDFPSFRNVVIAGNYAGNNGGGYFTSHSGPRMTNVTITGNRAGNVGGAIYRNSTINNATYLHNSIVWNNEDSSGVGTSSAAHGGPGANLLNASHTLIQGMFPAGTGNLDGTDPANNPLFAQAVDPATAPTSVGDVRILRGSPVIDQGDNQAPINAVVYPFVPLEGNVLTDLDGFARIVDGDNDTVATVDLGVYEAQQPNVTLTKAVEPSSGTVAPGDPITYTLAFTNTGLDIATNVVITDDIPTGVEILSVMSSGVVVTETAVYPNYAWQISDLQPDESGTITLIGRIAPGFTSGGILVNTAVVTATHDTPATDNSDTASLTVCPTHVVVQNNNVIGAGSLRQAIIDVCDGGLITFNPSLSNGNIAINTNQTLTKAITIDGSDAPLLNIFGNTWDINNGGHLTISAAHFSNAIIRINDGGRLTSDRALWTYSSGILVADGGQAAIYNSTIINGTAVQGIVNIATGGTAEIHHTTITNNTTSMDSGGIFNNGTLTLTHSIVSGNNGDDPPYEIGGSGTFISQYNVLGVGWMTTVSALGDTFVPDVTDFNATSDGTPTPLGDIFPLASGYPLLADNGGPTLSVALQTTSPAIDLTPFTDCLPVDQRGFFRPSGAGCDAGSYEAQVGGALPGGNGPGGVGNRFGQTDLRLWLRTDNDMDGTSTNAPLTAIRVAVWGDQSGYGNDATQANATNQPILWPNSYNGLPAVQFDGLTHFLETGSIPALDTNRQTMFVVGQSSNTGLNVFVRTAYTGGTSGSNFVNNHMVGIFNEAGLDVWHARQNDGAFVGSNVSGDTSAHLYTLQWSGNLFRNWRDGLQYDYLTTATALPTGHITTRLGQNYNGDGLLDGQIAEVIIFNEALNRAQIHLVNNYLSARYDLPLVDTDYYTGDVALNGNYDWDVAGIGQESDGRHEQAHSGGLIIQNNGFLQDDGDYLLVGHDGGVNEVVTADWTDRRWSRVWACTKTDVDTTGGMVNLIFDFSDAGMTGHAPAEPASNYQLLKRDGLSGSFTAVATATAISDDRVIFENVDTADLCSYLTLGALNDVPLVVQMQAMTAQSGHTSNEWLLVLVMGLMLGTVWVFRRFNKGGSIFPNSRG